MMVVYDVVFGTPDSNKKHYYYRSNLQLEVNGVYRIFSATREYSTPVTVLHRVRRDAYDTLVANDFEDLVEIVKADCVKAPKVPADRIKVVNFNKKNRVTAVRWADGTVTKVTCQDMDQFDEEKALALCYMKRWCFDNRACFNNVFKKYCTQEEQKDDSNK